jgi:4-carboxymuconolactone decarboxylase
MTANDFKGNEMKHDTEMKKSAGGRYGAALSAVLAITAIASLAHAQAPAPASVSSSAPAQSRAQQLMGATNPKLAELTDKVLFGDVWERPGLSKRDRSLATVAALIAMNRPDQLRSHLALARTNGVTEAELIELITHMAFYAGWPAGVAATAVAKEVFQK